MTNANPLVGYLPKYYPIQKDTVQTLKATPGRIQGWALYNPNASVAFIQFFDVASATSIVLGTTIPTFVMPLPAGAAANLLDKDGIVMENGIKLACTTTSTGLTPPTTGLDITIFFK